MVVVTFDGDFISALSKASQINNHDELNRIVLDINNDQFTDYETLARKIRKYVDDFDPKEEDRYKIVLYIVNMLRPELQDLLSPVQVILSLRPEARRPRYLCFGGK